METKEYIFWLVRDLGWDVCVNGRAKKVSSVLIHSLRMAVLKKIIDLRQLFDYRKTKRKTYSKRRKHIVSLFPPAPNLFVRAMSGHHLGIKRGCGLIERSVRSWWAYRDCTSAPPSPQHLRGNNRQDQRQLHSQLDQWIDTWTRETRCTRGRTTWSKFDIPVTGNVDEMMNTTESNFASRSSLGAGEPRIFSPCFSPSLLTGNILTD
jgi:hypothetical protein